MSQKSIEFREDIRTAQRSFKILRKLCRQYGMSFQGPGARSEAQKGKSKNAAKAKPKPKPKKNIHSQLFRPEAPSSSESDFSSADDPDGLEHRTQWEDVESILGRLRMDDRVNALEDISESLNKSSQRAQQELLELDLSDSAGVRIRRAGWTGWTSPCSPTGQTTCWRCRL
ncbi:unnamed protein product [Prorocentrum cordatum]|nr:unnamed protein product [Polarella glacialis]